MRKKLPFYLFFINLFFFIHGSASANDLTDFILIPASDNTKSFYIGQYPVTNAQYKIFTDNTGTKKTKILEKRHISERQRKSPRRFRFT